MMIIFFGLFENLEMFSGFPGEISLHVDWERKRTMASSKCYAHFSKLYGDYAVKLYSMENVGRALCIPPFGLPWSGFV